MVGIASGGMRFRVCVVISANAISKGVGHAGMRRRVSIRVRPVNVRTRRRGRACCWAGVFVEQRCVFEN